MIEERTVDYAFRWLLGSFDNQSNLPRVAFLLDWLTGKLTEIGVCLVHT